MPSVVDQFMASYRQGHSPSRERAENVVEICRRAFRQSGILCDITYSATDSGRLEGKLRTREVALRKPYQRVEEIEADIDDLECVSVQVHLPSEKQRVSDVIKNNFKIYWPLDEPGDTNLDTEYYWVALKAEKDMRPPKLVEIKVSTDAGNRLFQDQHDLGVYLCKWAAVRGTEGDCGDVRPLWELLKLLNLRRVAAFRDILTDLDVSMAPGSEYSCKRNGFSGLEFSLAMYVTDWLMGQPCAKKRIQETDNFWERSSESQQQRHKMEIIRNSFIWLAYLYSWGEGAGKMLLGHMKKAEQDIQQQRIVWLDDRCTKAFYHGRTADISVEENNDLNQLWRLFEEHPRLPAKYVFNLARLGVEGHAPPRWGDFRRAIQDLVYSTPGLLDRS